MSGESVDARTHTLSRRRGLALVALASMSAGRILLGASPAAALDDAPLSYPFHFNPALVDAFVTRRGGPIGTSGRTAIAFRCDHHLNKFASMLLPRIGSTPFP
jgi:hypothetical protein